MLGNRYEPKVALEDKVYPKTYYKHQLGSVIVDEILAKIKTQGLQIVEWTLIED
jgi:signal recognition particle subunit SEC65